MAEKNLKFKISAVNKTERVFNNVKSGLSNLKRSVFNLRNAFIGLGTATVIRGFVKAGIQIENLEVQLNALMGSAKEGKKALKSVTDFASGTPFELKEIQKGVVALATVKEKAEEFGISFEELLKITGNTAVQIGGDFAQASLNIQRSFSAGIGSADLFRDRAVTAMAGFQAGVKVSVDESIIGLQKAFGTGGKFGNLTDNLSQTLFGTISNLKDAFFIFQVEVSKGFFEALKNNLGDLKKSAEDNKKAIAEFGRNLGDIFSKTIDGTAKAVKFLKENLDLLITTFKVLIALKIVQLFTKITVAVGLLNASFLTFNATVKRNLIFGGIAVVILEFQKLKDIVSDALKDAKEFFGLFSDEKKEKKVTVITIKKSPLPNIDIKDRPIFTPKPPLPDNRDQAKVIKDFPSVLDRTLSKVRVLNEEALAKTKEKFNDISTTISETLNSSIRGISESIARTIIFGENLKESFKQIVSQALVKALSILIEIGIRTLVNIGLAKLKERQEKRITAEHKKQNRELDKQIVKQAILLAMGGGSGGIGIPFLASGGQLKAGQPAVVGERGAELIIPNNNSTVFSNSDTKKILGSGKNVSVSFNIMANDTRDFDTLIIKRRGLIVNLINQALNERGKEAIV
jgi:hypothetical protein